MRRSLLLYYTHVLRAAPTPPNKYYMRMCMCTDAPAALLPLGHITVGPRHCQWLARAASSRIVKLHRAARG